MSSASESVKVLVVGPKTSGKSTIANFLSNFRDSPSPEYHPTIGVRILEFEREGLQFSTQHTKKGSNKVSVELWDTSGDTRFESCWPAILKDANGVLFVYNQDVRGNDKELEIWHRNFAQALKLRDSCCLIFAHKSLGQPSVSTAASLAAQRAKMPKQMQKINLVETSLDTKELSDKIRSEFDRLLEAIVIAKRETEEQMVLAT